MFVSIMLSILACGVALIWVNWHKKQRAQKKSGNKSECFRKRQGKHIPAFSFSKKCLFGINMFPQQKARRPFWNKPCSLRRNQFAKSKAIFGEAGERTTSCWKPPPFFNPRWTRKEFGAHPAIISHILPKALSWAFKMCSAACSIPFLNECLGARPLSRSCPSFDFLTQLFLP